MEFAQSHTNLCTPHAPTLRGRDSQVVRLHLHRRARRAGRRSKALWRSSSGSAYTSGVGRGPPCGCASRTFWPHGLRANPPRKRIAIERTTRMYHPHGTPPPGPSTSPGAEPLSRSAGSATRLCDSRRDPGCHSRSFSRSWGGGNPATGAGSRPSTVAQSLCRLATLRAGRHTRRE